MRGDREDEDDDGDDGRSSSARSTIDGDNVVAVGDGPGAFCIEGESLPTGTTRSGRSFPPAMVEDGDW